MISQGLCLQHKAALSTVDGPTRLTRPLFAETQLSRHTRLCQLISLLLPKAGGHPHSRATARRPPTALPAGHSSCETMLGARGMQGQPQLTALRWQYQEQLKQLHFHLPEEHHAQPSATVPHLDLLSERQQLPHPSDRCLQHSSSLLRLLQGRGRHRCPQAESKAGHQTADAAAKQASQGRPCLLQQRLRCLGVRSSCTMCPQRQRRASLRQTWLCRCEAQCCSVVPPGQGGPVDLSCQVPACCAVAELAPWAAKARPWRSTSSAACACERCGDCHHHPLPGCCCLIPPSRAYRSVSICAIPSHNHEPS